MNWQQVLRWRIERQFLGGSPADDAVTAARRLSGVHAQLAASAVTALDLRVAGGATAESVDAELWETKRLVKTWAARGTLHLLPAADLPTWVAAMSTRTRETTGSWLRYHGVTAEQMADIIAAMPDVLGGEPLTREELAGAIIKATRHKDLREPLTQGFGAVLKPLAFRGLLCSGPPRGRNVTFVAPRAWLREWDEVDTEAAIDTLTLAYLGTYGPSTADEFSRWFDLKPALAKKSFARLADQLVEVDGGALVAELAGEVAKKRPLSVRLLPAFDPYTVASLRQADRVVTGPNKAKVSRPQGWISPVLVVDGRIEGVWEGDTVTPFAPLERSVRSALTKGFPEVSVAD
ncbi:winged helix DNA-binding domain-containing protein [Phytohabitans sp. LJ34]|uniref:winged helix DNA-binding domain-containing protein n=1 Tax=Phytohabitans sp. LJ34 TaxID=3452217 RepID=UPI003F8CAD9E